MISTKENPGPFDGMVRAEPGEPVFTLRAHDVLAPPLVRLWVERKRAQLVRAEMTEDALALKFTQCRDAEDIAEAMEAWQADGDQAAAPEPEKAPTQLVELEPGELEAKARWDAVTAAAKAIHNAVALVSDAGELLAPYHWGSERFELISCSERLEVVAFQVQPKRVGYAVTDQDRERAAAKAGG